MMYEADGNVSTELDEPAVEVQATAVNEPQPSFPFVDGRWLAQNEEARNVDPV